MFGLVTIIITACMEVFYNSMWLISLIIKCESILAANNKTK